MLKKAVNRTYCMHSHSSMCKSTDFVVRYADFQVLPHEKTDI